MPIEKIAVVNVFGSSNRGDAALVDVCLSELKAVFPAASISGVAYQPELEQGLTDVAWYERPGKCNSQSRFRRRACNLVRQALVYAYVLLGQPRAVGHLLPRAQRDAVREILGADLVVSCPGGYLQDSNPSYLAALTQLWIAIRGRGVVVMAHQSIGPVRSRIGRSYLRYILKKCSMICVRESESKRFVDQLLKDTPAVRQAAVRQVGDLAFALAPVGQGVSEAQRELGLRLGQYIAASVVDWSFPLSGNPRAARRRYVEQMAHALEKIYLSTKLKILLVNQVAADLSVADEVVAQCSEETRRFIVIDREERTVEEVRRLVGGARAFLGSRFHSCIFALLESVPVIAISYLPKTSGIMADLGLSRRVIDIYDINGATVAEAVASLLVMPEHALEEQRCALVRYTGRFPSLREVLMGMEVFQEAGAGAEREGVQNPQAH